ncbi:unnamed protein product [Rotaria sp. Silwood2]|nr:unnamed protein product [Rotaria sp. Silwood2]CAF4497795.1 unnamed protein product [Rotaria sp. Silwood2]
MMEFIQYRNNDHLSPILLIRKRSEETDILQFYPFSNTLEITFNDTLVKKCFSSFDLTRALDVDELSHLIRECALIYDLNLDVSFLEETLKTKILFDRTSYKFSSYFLTVAVKLVQIDESSKASDQIPVNDYHSFNETDMDAIIGRTYSTRGVKRTYEEDPISVEPNQNMYRRNKMIKDKRDLLHLKDSYHLTDAALNAIFHDIKSVKQISIGSKVIDIRVRLGGDLMNAVYVYGLAGFSSNYPCIFYTQHKDDLHVTEDTAYDKNITEGQGKNKKAITVRVGPTSSYDPAKRARSLVEQASCLAKKTNDLGYKCEPLFGDLFNYQDYCIDTLHMKLRVFDVILKDILSCASRTGVLKRLSLEFVKEFRQSGLRTTVTPYIHIIGNHLFEFDEFNDLGDYNMQGVEKNNDVLSRLYFSSTNPAKNPLLTMLQKMYRMLEMNFEDENEREAMAIFARTGVHDFVEDLSEYESKTESNTPSCSDEENDVESEEESAELDLCTRRTEEDDEDETDSEESLLWAPEKRFRTLFLSRSQNQFKSFRRS